VEIEFVRRFCLSLPGATEQVQWGEHLVFKVGGKVYLILALEPSKYLMSFKVEPEVFDELIERGGMAQAPYCAKRQWIALEPQHPLSPAELTKLLRRSYDLVFAKLTKKLQAQITPPAGQSPDRPARRAAQAKSTRPSRPHPAPKRR
jgi:predicted DNA-binding protein (MmcQ/YjbR family)